MDRYAQTYAQAAGMTLIPRQPFMVELSNRYCKYVYQRDGISLFYQFETDDETSQISTSVPDGCIDIIFHHRADGSKAGADYYGTDLLPHAMKCHPGHIHFGVRFQPGVTPFCAQIGMGDLVDQIVPFEQATAKPLGQFLPEAIAASETFESKINLFLSCMPHGEAGELEPEGTPARLQRYLTQSIIRSHGTLPVQELAEQVGYSVSYLNKLLSRSMAISVKKFSQIVQYQSLLNCLYQDGRLKTESPNWGVLAAQFGYYDQSHLINSFKRFSNRTPNAFLRELKGIDFNNRLHIIHV